MIVYRNWTRTRKLKPCFSNSYACRAVCEYDGWFLLGVLPLYVRCRSTEYV